MPLPLRARQPSLYIPHGGGPCFFMDPIPGLAPDTWDAMPAYLRGHAATLPYREKLLGREVCAVQFGRLAVARGRQIIRFARQRMTVLRRRYSKRNWSTIAIAFV
jgi:hypothetical protein